MWAGPMFSHACTVFHAQCPIILYNTKMVIIYMHYLLPPLDPGHMQCFIGIKRFL